jgi:hypothetical protein
VRIGTSQSGGRAFGLGPRSAFAAAVVAIVVVGVAAGLFLGRPYPAPASTGHYGGLPSWLPKATIPVNRVVTATAAHPALAIQGDTVRVDLPGGQVLATVVGPAVPEEGQFPVPQTSKCTFTVTFTGATARIRLIPAAFTSIDEEGHVHGLRVTAQGGGSPARDVAPGQTVTLIMKAVLPTGDGQLRWMPTGSVAIASWDFDVEID